MIPSMTASAFPRSRLDEARARISGSVHRTPLYPSRTLSERIGVPVLLKCENLQKTGAFKVRGALNRLLTLDPEARARGVATISAGNHAQAIAWAATAAGIPCTVVMPEHASPTKVRASRAYGAEVILHGDAASAFRKVREVARERGLTFVHPFDDEEVVAGHASCGLEIVEEAPEAETIVVPVGGGGLASGIAVAVAACGTGARIWGVEPEGAAAMSRSLETGRAVHLDRVSTVADGLAAPMAGELNYDILRRQAEGIALVRDEEIVEAMAFLLERTKLLTEPAGAAGVAALLTGRIPVAGTTVVILSGGNVDLAQLGPILAELA